MYYVFLFIEVGCGLQKECLRTEEQRRYSATEEVFSYKGGRVWLTLNAKLTKLTLQLQFLSYHLTFQRRSVLIQKLSIQVTKAFHQHGIAEKVKLILGMNALIQTVRMGVSVFNKILGFSRFLSSISHFLPIFQCSGL